MYNVIKSDVIGYFLYFLMFGWYLWFFIDFFLGINFDEEEYKNYSDYVGKL